MSDSNKFMKNLGLLCDLISNTTAGDCNSLGQTQDPVEQRKVDSRLRKVIPQVLKALFSCGKGKGREKEKRLVLQVLQTVVARRPEAFFNGEPHAVVPLIYDLLLILASIEHQAFSELAADCIASLLQLLCRKHTAAFRQFVRGLIDALVDLQVALKAMYLDTDLVHSVRVQACELPGVVASPTVREAGSDEVSDLTGILLTIKDESQWQRASNSVVTVLAKCLAVDLCTVSQLIGGLDVCEVVSFLRHADCPLQEAITKLLALLLDSLDPCALPIGEILCQFAHVLHEWCCTSEPVAVDERALRSRIEGNMVLCLDSLDACTGKMQTVFVRELLSILPNILNVTATREFRSGFCKFVCGAAAATGELLQPIEDCIPLLCDYVVSDAVQALLRLRVETESFWHAAEDAQSHKSQTAAGRPTKRRKTVNDEEGHGTNSKCSAPVGLLQTRDISLYQALENYLDTCSPPPQASIEDRAPEQTAACSETERRLLGLRSISSLTAGRVGTTLHCKACKLASAWISNIQDEIKERSPQNYRSLLLLFQLLRDLSMRPIMQESSVSSGVDSVSKLAMETIDLLRSLYSHNPYTIPEELVVPDLDMSLDSLLAATDGELAVYSFKSALQCGFGLDTSDMAVENQMTPLEELLVFGLRHSSCSFRCLSIAFLPRFLPRNPIKINLKQTITLYSKDRSSSVRCALARTLPDLARMHKLVTQSNQPAIPNTLFTATLKSFILEDNAQEVVKESLRSVPLLASALENSDLFTSLDSSLVDKLISLLSCAEMSSLAAMCFRGFAGLEKSSLQHIQNRLQTHLYNTAEDETKEAVLTASCSLSETLQGYELFPVFLSLVDHLDAHCWKEPAYQYKVSKLMLSLARKRKVPLRALILPCETDIYLAFADTPVSRISLIQRYSEVVHATELEVTVQEMLPTVIPHLIVQHAEGSRPNETERVIRAYADILATTPTHLIFKKGGVVCAAVLMKFFPSKPEQLEKAMNFVTEVSAEKDKCLDLSGFFLSHLQNIVNELCWKLVDNGDCSGLENFEARLVALAQIVDKPKWREMFISCFLGVLFHLEKQIRNHTSAPESKAQAIRVLTAVVPLVQDDITPFVPKIMGLLTMVLQDKGVVLVALDCWRCLIAELAKHAQVTLQNSCIQIVAIMLECFDYDDPELVERAADVLNCLIVRNRDILRKFMHGMPVLPSLPCLREVNQILCQFRGGDENKLQRIVDGLQHESSFVKRTILRELRRDLSSRPEFYLSLAAVDSEVLSDIIVALLESCRFDGRGTHTDLSQLVRQLSVICLGEIGALDPSRLKRKLRAPNVYRPINNVKLVGALVTQHLVPLLHSNSEIDVQNASSYALQQILKLAGLGLGDADGESDSQSRGGKELDRGDLEDLMNELPETVQEMIQPFRSSKLTVTRQLPDSPSGLAFRPGISLVEWLMHWTYNLSTFTKRVYWLYELCSSVREVIRHDAGVSLYLLPHLVRNVLLLSQNAFELVVKEMNAVLSHAVQNLSRESFENSNQSSDMFVQTIFSLIDNILQCIANCRVDLANIRQLSEKKQGYQQYQEYQKDLQIKIKTWLKLLDRIPKRSLALAAYNCGASARAFRYLEWVLRDGNMVLNQVAEVEYVPMEEEDVSLLMKLYRNLDDVDSPLGLASIRHSFMGLEERRTIYEHDGRLSDAITCCEQGLKKFPDDIATHSAMLEYKLQLGHVEEVLAHAEGTIARHPASRAQLRSQTVAAAWRLGRWSLLKEYLEDPDSQGCGPGGTNSRDGIRSAAAQEFDIDLARMLSHFHEGRYDKVKDSLATSRDTLLNPLVAASMESYERAYPFIVKLHMLRELEDGLLCKTSPEPSPLPLGCAQWDQRLNLTKQSLKTREPIVALRRVVLGEAGLNASRGKWWLQYAKLCRKMGYFETAHSAILAGEDLGEPGAALERAKLFWYRAEQFKAIQEAEQWLSLSHTPELRQVAQLHPNAKRRATSSATMQRAASAAHEDLDAKALLLLCKWVSVTGQRQPQEVLALYDKAIQRNPNSETAWFRMAKFFDALFQDAYMRQIGEGSIQGLGNYGAAGQYLYQSNGRSKNWVAPESKHFLTYLPPAMEGYSKALKFGHKHIYDCLPRLLTLWFNFGGQNVQMFANATPDDCIARITSKEQREVEHKITCAIKSAYETLPPHYWLTAFSQLTSRIVQHHRETHELLKKILVLVVSEYPQTTLWYLAILLRSSSDKERAQVANEVFHAAKGHARSKEESRLYSEYFKFLQYLSTLCSHLGGRQYKEIKEFNLREHNSALKRLMPYSIALPTQRSLLVDLASHVHDSKTNRFSQEVVTIDSFVDKVKVMSSLQRPKRVTLVGSDRKEYNFLFKPGDDLRKDQRMMEFNTLVNRLLKRNPSSRKRNLYIRTYAVVPLAEKCGVLEWVNNTTGLRYLITPYLTAIGAWTNPPSEIQKKIASMYDKVKKELDSTTPGVAENAAITLMRESLLPRFPPQLHKWFLEKFPEPSAWYQAKTAFARTAAVWSMVGQSVGLGDRHGENILIDGASGDLMHVDFGMMFDHALKLDVPERVPFRLTQNMVDAMGVAGYEGTFRRNSEITMDVLRRNREMLMSVLESFIHDPLLEWKGSGERGESGQRLPAGQPEARTIMSNIDGRLRGSLVGVGALPSLPLSVEGQVQRLIEEASSYANLGRMYRWWMPWM